MVSDSLDLLLRVIAVVAGAGAIYFAYRVARITGIFLAWFLFVLAVLVRAGDNVIELMIDLGSIPASNVFAVFMEDTLLPLALSILLVLFSYQLARTFKRQLKRPGSP